MNNVFNDALPNHLRIATDYKGKKIDAEAVRAELSRWVGWYHKESAEDKTPKEQHGEASRIVDLLSELQERMATPTGMHPNLRAHVKENMRQLRMPMPEFARLAACVKSASQQLSQVRTGPRSNEARDNAIRAVFHALQKYSTPSLGKIEARDMAAQLVRDSIGIHCPDDPKELRKIVGGN